jgi:hypothetical protein
LPATQPPPEHPLQANHGSDDERTEGKSPPRLFWLILRNQIES